MGNLAWHQKHGRLSLDQYLEFLETRPEEERWQLIDGVAVMMTPPSFFHQRIAKNLIRQLDLALEKHRPDLIALYEAGLITPGYEDFRPEADVVVVDSELDEAAGRSSYNERFYLVAEVLSPSNREEYIDIKRARYTANPHNLYCLIISQSEMRVEVLARANDWRAEVLVEPGDLVRLAEFGFECEVRAIYEGTPLVR